MKLKIENGILLKPYDVPWREDGYRKPPGWTPDPDLPGLHDRALELDALMKEAENAPPIPNLALRQAEAEYERKMQAAKKPYPRLDPDEPASRPRHRPRLPGTIHSDEPGQGRCADDRQADREGI